MARSQRISGASPWAVQLSSAHESGLAHVSARTAPGDGDAVDDGEPLRLLLIEDSDNDAKLILRELRRGGFRPACERAVTQAAFRTALASAPWDTVVADYAVPGYGGLEALEDLKASGKDIPFILVSGTIGEAVAVEAMRAGAQDYVLKQDLTRLPVAIARELREKAVRAEKDRMREQLLISDRMASAGMLAAGVAHEINNPLAVAVSNVDYSVGALDKLLSEVRAFEGGNLLGGGAPWDGWARLEMLLDVLNDAGEGLRRIRDIVRDVKVFSRPLDDKAGALDVRKVLDSSVRMARNEIRHRAQLVKDYGEVPMVHANESRLGQVVLNLVVNAAQSIPEGHADANEIRLVTKTDDAGWAIIEVADTGCGISAQHLERIFDPFFTTKAVGEGTGLGLSICHRIVTELGGRIGVKSEVGTGTVFRVALPSSQRAPEAGPPAAEATALPGRRKRVLVVDDEPSIGKALGLALEDHHDVVVVTRAAEALTRVASGERFDVIFSDLMMPDVTGMEMHERLKLMAPDQAERVVFLTGGAFTASARAYLDRVANRTVDKPFKAGELLAVIATFT